MNNPIQDYIHPHDQTQPTLILKYVWIVNGTKSNIFTCKLCAWIVWILLTGLLWDNLNSLTYKPWKGQSPTLSREYCVTVYLDAYLHEANITVADFWVSLSFMFLMFLYIQKLLQNAAIQQMA